MNYTQIFRAIIIVIIAVVSSSAMASDQGGINYGFRLINEIGAPVAGPINVEVSLYGAANGGEALFVFEVFHNVPLRKGIGHVTLKPRPHKLPAYVATMKQYSNGGLVFSQLRDLSNQKVYPRQRFGSVPFAEFVRYDPETLAYNEHGQLTVVGGASHNGTVGPKGDVGPVGPKGDVGPAGAKGNVGPAGAKGDVGPAGAKGNVGPAGAKGNVGPAGAKGNVGPAGPKGDAGIAGAKGDTGLAGPMGPKGQDGAGYPSYGQSAQPVKDAVFANGSNIGIGTLNPQQKLDVQGAISVSSSSFTATAKRGVLDYCAECGEMTRIITYGPNANQAGGFRIDASSSNASINKTRLAIDSQGNVGIGTASPEATLDVKGSVKLFGARIPALANGHIPLGHLHGPSHSDGFLVVSGRRDGAAGTTKVSVLVGTTTQPNEIRAAQYTHNNGQTYLGTVQITVPIRKGEYYKVQCDGQDQCPSPVFIGEYVASFIPFGG